MVPSCGSPTAPRQARFWYQAPSGTRSYSNGVPLHNLDVIGSAWRKPESLALVLGLTDPGGNNVALQFSQARINETNVSGQSSNLSIPFRLKAPGNVFVASSPNATKLSCKIDPATGEISGLWKTTDMNPQPPSRPYERTANFYGAVVNRLGQGAGHFVLPRLPTTGQQTTTTPILSGKMVFQGCSRHAMLLCSDPACLVVKEVGGRDEASAEAALGFRERD